MRSVVYIPANSVIRFTTIKARRRKPRGPFSFMPSATPIKAASGSFSDRRRGTRQERGYGAAWDKARKRVMLRDCGLCQPCKRANLITIAAEVDHIVNKAIGGTEDDDNLQAICGPCHETKTAQEAAQARGIQTIRPSAACNTSGLPTDKRHPWVGAGGGNKLHRDPTRTDLDPSLAGPRNG